MQVEKIQEKVLLVSLHNKGLLLHFLYNEPVRMYVCILHNVLLCLESIPPSTYQLQ